MGRALLYNDRDIFGAVAVQMLRTGKIAMAALSDESGVSIGSLYHRFGSKEQILAETWLSAVRDFQDLFISALHSDEDPQACGERAALATPRFCRKQVKAASLLACCSQSQFMGPKTPKPIRDEIRAVNESAAQAVSHFSETSGYTPLQCRLALVEYPLATVKVFLPRRPVSRAVDKMVLAACRAVFSV